MKRKPSSEMDELPFSKHKFAGRSFYSVEEYKKFDASEAELQTDCEDYLKQNEIPYIHIPSHAYKTQKVKAGIPDLIIFKDAHYNWININYALLIELKKKGGKPRQGQKNFARHSNVYLIYSFPDFKTLVDKFERI